MSICAYANLLHSRHRILSHFVQRTILAILDVHQLTTIDRSPAHDQDEHTWANPSVITGDFGLFTSSQRLKSFLKHVWNE